MTIYWPNARITDLRIPNTDLTIYHLGGPADWPYAVASERLLDPRTIDPNNLPTDVRWVTLAEWEAASERRFVAVRAAEAVERSDVGRLERQADAAIVALEAIRRELAEDRECVAETHAEIMRVLGWYYCQP